jgi:GNAT superfamily N-acetyltransferase
VDIRPATVEDTGFLEAMLFEAFFWDVAVERPAFATFRQHPEFMKLISGWGRRGDRGVIAEQSGRPIGAAWFRLWTPESHSYGFIDATTPELGMAVVRMHRRQGIGRTMLEALIAMARADEFPALSLSVNPFNPARLLYESLGFQKVGESGTSWTLRRTLE